LELSHDLLRLILPEFLLSHFSFEKSESNGEEELHLYFTEKNKIPKEYEKDLLESKGFYDEITIQDFPLRGRYVYLHIKRRRWLNKTIGKVVSRNWDVVAKGTRMTAEFASFLKGINR